MHAQLELSTNFIHRSVSIHIYNECGTGGVTMLVELDLK